MEQKFFRVRSHHTGFPPASVVKKHKEASLFDEIGEYEIEIHDCNYTYTLHVEHEKLPLVPDWFMVTAYIGKENVKTLKKIEEIIRTAPYTRESLQYTFRKYPNILKLLGLWSGLMLNIQGVELGEESISKRYICFSSDFFPSGYKEKTKDFIKFVNGLLNELESEICINTSDLVINQTLVDTVNGIRNVWNNTPRWVKTALAVGGVIAVKAIIRDACTEGLNIGGDNNSSLGAADFDGSDFDGSDFDGSDYDGSVYEQGYNVSFGANRTIGSDTYLDRGTITLERAGGGLGDKDVTVYVKAGTNTRYILDGNIPRKIDGMKFTILNGIKYIIR